MIWIILSIVLVLEVRLQGLFVSGNIPNIPDSVPQSAGSSSAQWQPTRQMPFIYARHLAKVEEDIYKYMAEYKHILKSRLEIVSNYVKDYQHSTLRGTSHLDERKDPLARATAVASHPLMYFRLMKRFANEVMALRIDLSKNVEADLTEKLVSMVGSTPWPTTVERLEAVFALLRLQHVYNLDLKEFSKGNIGGKQTAMDLTVADSFLVAKNALDGNLFTHAMDWLQVTTWKSGNLADKDKGDAIDPQKLSLVYQDFITRHNKYIKEVSGNMFTYTKPITETKLPPTVLQATREILGKLKSSQLNELELPAKAALEFPALCQGKNPQSKATKARLHCYYENKNHPYWYINPLKAEVHNIEPGLVQIYDFLEKKAVDLLTLKAMEYIAPLDPAQMLRIPKYLLLNDSDIPQISLSRKIELYTGLYVRGSLASTELRVGSLTIGAGGIEPLRDESLGHTGQNRGDRISTVLLYLNEVEKGGQTAFPILGATISPVRGSALFYSNTLRNGTIDGRMIQGTCPPILGYQWIAEKWIYQNKNVLRAPCDLNPNI